ncbi:MAG: thioredoxin family protein [Chloroflexota bacterium]|nr:thioredoxin family protein [Chloroflexota bacterium]
MAIVSDDLKAQLRERLGKSLTEPVVLTLHTARGDGLLVLPDGECETCGLSREIADALVEAAGGRVTLAVVDGQVPDVPVLEVARPGDTARIVFRGLPAGYEFSTLLDAVERVSTGRSELSPETVSALSALTTDIDLQVFVTPTCPYCPSAASMANRLALASPRVHASTVAANEFPELSDRFGVRGVPHTVVNSSGSFVGALPEAAFLGEVLRLGNPRVN